ncbi:MAG: hypothetical protein ACHP84_09530 [Caulobacterales bacterium]
MHRMLVIIASLALALAEAGAAHAETARGAPTGKVAALHCVSGVPCGKKCIARDQVCHQPKPPRAPFCKTGKPCGNNCIPKAKVCRSGRSKAFFDNGGSQLYLSRVHPAAPPGNSIVDTNTVAAPRP